jgi:hypothetical protein
MFPNASRSYDATRHAVRFWGYDSAMEWSFFVTVDALARIHPSLAPNEAGMLGAFDSHRDRICAAAARLYARGRKGSYELGRGRCLTAQERRHDPRARATRRGHFAGPFALKGVDRLLPAGSYRVATDES